MDDRVDGHASIQRRLREKVDSENLHYPSNTTPTSESSGGGTFRAGVLCPITPRGTDCSKKGLGFRSKSRLAKLKAEEEERQEKERLERERREARIPKKIRKDFKKYGFSIGRS